MLRIKPKDTTLTKHNKHRTHRNQHQNNPIN